MRRWQGCLRAPVAPGALGLSVLMPSCPHSGTHSGRTRCSMSPVRMGKAAPLPR